jgi:lysyl-tRNA synthetase class 1
MSTGGTDPYTLRDAPGPDDGDHHVFWADQVADRVEERLADRPDEDGPIIVKGGISPSGVPHFGNVNEIMRGYYVAEALRGRGHEVRQVFTTDDRDPLRKVPRKLANLDGEVVGLGEVDAGALGRNLGKPYTAIPDPFGCCDSYGDHFSTLVERAADQLGVPIDVVSNTDLYESGDFEGVTRYLMEHQDRAREVLEPYQDKVDEDYVPFNPICGSCGKVTETVLSYDAEAGTVEYECTDGQAGDQIIEGCGHRGTATLREGKLPWRFEWPAQWRVLDVDHEPFGKDHAEGSWPSGADIARNVLDDEPPVPMVYEWFTLNGEAFSSSEGNVILVGEVLDLVEPEVVRYFFAKDPGKARDFDVAKLDQLTDEFDRFERAFYGEVAAGARTEGFADRAYPDVVRPTVATLEDDGRFRVPADGPRSVPVPDPAERDRLDGLVRSGFDRRVRLPYTFAAVLGMSEDPGVRESIARKEGHVPDDAPEWAVGYALARVELARQWASHTDNEFNYELKRTELPDVDFDDRTAEALDELADYVAEGHDGEAIQGEIYETAKRHDVDVGDFFAAGYRLLFDQPEGPKLGTFLGKLDREFVVERLRREA